MIPITLTADEVRPILSGGKTQVRRVVQVPAFGGISPRCYVGRNEELYTFAIVRAGAHVGVRCPFGTEGDRLWVREEFTIHRCEP